MYNIYYISLLVYVSTFLSFGLSVKHTIKGTAKGIDNRLIYPIAAVADMEEDIITKEILPGTGSERAFSLEFEMPNTASEFLLCFRRGAMGRRQWICYTLKKEYLTGDVTEFEPFTPEKDRKLSIKNRGVIENLESYATGIYEKDG
ncbi:hypothetical protein DdX_17371 [Ditylenchus destructor]|uniref:Uncharacterized protein n=1 Tax=Ditylenchus destructor TaxID=166010 RepID=A0AAD4MS04_9BILA|nr:hypothetical protein DdX_17371 [Ditylenchus destructor]